MPVKMEFQAHGLVLHYLGRIFLEAPTREFVDHIAREDLFGHWPLTGGSDIDYKPTLDILRRFFVAWRPAFLNDLEQDYTALFIGLEHTLAPPYESVYLSRDHIIFERQTLDVRNHYTRAGLEIPNIRKEPDDHIGYELQFVAHCCQGAPESGMDELRAFLRSHLLKWAFQFTDRVVDHAISDYYRAHALLTNTVVQSLSQLAGLDTSLDP